MLYISVWNWYRWGTDIWYLSCIDAYKFYHLLWILHYMEFDVLSLETFVVTVDTIGSIVTALTIKDILKKAILVTRNSAMNVYYDNQFWSNQKLLIPVHLEIQFLCGTIFVILNMEEKNLSYSRGQLSKLQYG